MQESLERLKAALADRYRLDRQVGAGGMATVYLAEDLKHHRQVAVKVLQPELAASLGADRFLREIELAARLTHPSILPLLDSGDANGVLYYVMPFVEGESLRARLDRERQLPVDEAIKIAQRVAQALDYAHGLGVIHRDIKPENILLSAGEPVVADFGIAKAVSAAGQTQLTQTGFAVGTAPYMSPEQAAAEAQLDGRSDLYALGCVLYEMLAGAPPFTGPSLQAITARKLTEPVPPLRHVRDTVPIALEQIVFKALAKLPADRYATGQQLAAALESARNSLATPAAPVPAFAPPPPARWTRLLPWGVALAAIAVAATLAWRSTGDAPGTLRLSVTTPSGTELYGFALPFALSPDGSTLVFAAGRNDSVRLYARRLDSFETRALPGTEGGDSPFFSPDGRWVGFFARKARELKKVALAGGSPVTVAADLAAVPQFGVWAQNDTIYFTNWPDQQVSKVAAGGGPAGALTHGQPPNGWFRFPLFVLPDGQHIAVGVWGRSGMTSGHLDLVSLATGEHQLLMNNACSGLLAASAYLLYVPCDKSELLAVPFDPRSLRVTGEPVTVLDSLAVDANPIGYVTASLSGTLAYAPVGRRIDPLAYPELLLVARDGTAEPRHLPSGNGPRFSPDGGRLVYAGLGRHDSDILMYDLARGTERHLTGDEGADLWPVFSADGRRVVFNSNRGRADGLLLLYTAPADGSGPAVRMPTDTLNHQQPFTWTAGGRDLLYTQGPNNAGAMEIWTVPTVGTAPPSPLIQTAASNSQPAMSPDGRWLAWMTDASGRPEVMVRRYPDGPAVPVSRDGGFEPAWGPGSKEIYFRDFGATGMMVASFQAGDPPVVGAPRVLFAGRYSGCSPWCRSYDVSPDGRRFVMIRNPEGFTESGYWMAGNEVRIVPHWDRELRAKMEAARR